MSSKLFPHLIPQHWDSGDAVAVSLWNPPVVKVVWDGVPPYLDQLPKQSVLVVRDYGLSENYHNRGFTGVEEARNMGREHARTSKKIADGIYARYGIQASRLKFEGLNEPRLWADEQPVFFTEYEVSRLRELHKFGLAAVVCNFSVGWPGNGGLEDAPPDWAPFEAIRKEMWPGDWLGVHEYFPFSGPQHDWLWLFGRYLQCPWDVPILLTEVGLDNAVVSGQHAGWQSANATTDEKAASYMEQLRWVDLQLHRDKRVVGGCIFTRDCGSQDWLSFDIRNTHFEKDYLLPHVRTYQAEPWCNPAVDRWEPLLVKYAEATGISEKVLATIVKLESNGNPHAISTAGAVGLMQIMPREAGPEFVGRPSAWMLRNPDKNVFWGSAILSANLNRYGGDLAKALAAYYAGAGTVDKYGTKFESARKYLGVFAKHWQDMWGLPLPFSTEDAEERPVDNEEIVRARFHSEKVTRMVEDSMREVYGLLTAVEDAVESLQAMHKHLNEMRSDLVVHVTPTLKKMEGID